MIANLEHRKAELEDEMTEIAEQIKSGQSGKPGGNCPPKPKRN
jgi:hypothetical protein